MTKTTLSPQNDSGFIAVLNTTNEPVENKNKLPIVFSTLKAGKTYLKKRFGESWTDYWFKMAKYNLPQNTDIMLS